ncbi:MAG: helix-turn-helix transcriptional regulator [Clostridiales Family XIII bacterium]|jgi:transcriptional regulator with XRE-family HTH domain|nr:helix-turn-helix transcriptional regulator [Clostridiales Family XIII bacterium]
MSRLQEQRKKAGLSQSRLAKASGVKVHMIQHYEQGFRDINGAAVVTVKALADVLGCRIEDLIEPAE